jgi:thiol-disulfide isomerase/thioredoxin
MVFIYTGMRRLSWPARLRWPRLGAFACLLAALSACNRPAAPLLPEGQVFPMAILSQPLGAIASGPAIQGKFIILNVWATWCLPCRQEMPSLERLSRVLDPKRYAVIGLSTDDDALLALEFLESGGVTFSNFHDQSGKLSKQLGLKVYPETFLIAPDGTLARRLTGSRDWSGAEMLALIEGVEQSKRGTNVRP